MNIKLEILKFNYWEHFKHAKDIALILPPEHPRRIEVEKHLNELQNEIKLLIHEASKIIQG